MSDNPEPRELLATRRQREYARRLGIEFSDHTTRAQMSQLIDDAVMRDTEKRYEELDELARRESDAWQKMREEVLAEIDADLDDCRLSTADTSQIVEALSKRGLLAILFTFPSDAIYDIGEAGTKIEVEASFSDDMSLEDVEKFVKEYALCIWKRDGIDMVGMMGKTAATMQETRQLLEASRRKAKAQKGH